MAALEKIKCIAGGERSCQFSLEAANRFFLVTQSKGTD